MWRYGVDVVALWLWISSDNYVWEQTGVLGNSRHRDGPGTVHSRPVSGNSNHDDRNTLYWVICVKHRTNPSCPSLWIAAHKTTCVKARPTEGRGWPPLTLHTHTTHAHSSPRERDRKVDMPMSQITCPGKSPGQKSDHQSSPNVAARACACACACASLCAWSTARVRAQYRTNGRPFSTRLSISHPACSSTGSRYLHTWSITIPGLKGGQMS